MRGTSIHRPPISRGNGDAELASVNFRQFRNIRRHDPTVSGIPHLFHNGFDDPIQVHRRVSALIQCTHDAAGEGNGYSRCL